jgi:hypothetical protein
VNIPYVPQASADTVPFPGGSGVDGTAALQIVGQFIDLNVGIGKGKVIILGMAGAEAVAVQQMIDYLALKVAILAEKYGLTLPAASSVAALGGLAGFAFVTTDWEAVYMSIFDPVAFEKYKIEMDSWFYNYTVNYSQFYANAAVWIAEFAGVGGVIYENSAREFYANVTKEGWQIIKDGFSGLLGGNTAPGVQEIPAVGWQQVFNMYGATIVSSNNDNTVYAMPVGTSVEGYDLTRLARDEYLRVRVESYIGEGNSAGLHRVDHSYPGNPQIGVGSGPGPLYVHILKEAKISGVFDYDLEIHQTGLQVLGVTKAEWLGIPAMSYINNMDAIQEQIDRIENKLDNLIFEFPHIENPTGDIHIDFAKEIELLQDWKPTPVPGNNPSDCPYCKINPGTCPVHNPIVALQPCPVCKADPCKCPPPPPNIDDLKLPDITYKFPFSVPFTIIACIELLNTKAEAPIFEIPFYIKMIDFNHTIVIDLSEFETVLEIIRWFFTLMFIIGLAFVTRGLIKG